jgi:hypothetical protein
VLSGVFLDAHEDLGAIVCGFLFGDRSDLYTNVFNEKTEMTIRLEFQAGGVRVSVPVLTDREYNQGVIAYADLGDEELTAFYGVSVAGQGCR